MHVREGAELGATELSRAQAGEAEAFGRFYDEHAAPLLRWFRTRTAAPDVAADLCAETFAAALEGLDGYDPSRGSERGWLYGIARNQLRHWLRRHYVDLRARRRLGIEVSTPHHDEYELIETRLDLEQHLGPLDVAVRALSGKLREALLLRVVEELSYREIAARLGCTEVTARVRVSRALNELTAGFPDGGLR